jgi:hypothetical protein
MPRAIVRGGTNAGRGCRGRPLAETRLEYCHASVELPQLHAPGARCAGGRAVELASPARPPQAGPCAALPRWQHRAVIAVTGYGQHIAGQIGGCVRGRFIAVGIDSAMQASAPWLAVAALKALADHDAIPMPCVDTALRRYALL